MADNDEGTTSPEGEAPEGTEPEAPVTEPQGTQPPVDEVTTLKSRNAGLDAKVTSLTKAQQEAIARAEAAEAKLAEIVSGKANGEEETRALLQRLTVELETERQRSKAATLAAKYPESYSELGDAIATMPEDKLAGIEARLAGVPAESNTPPPPVGNNAARPTTGAKSIADMTLEELKAHAEKQFATTTWADITQG